MLLAEMLITIYIYINMDINVQDLNKWQLPCGPLIAQNHYNGPVGANKLAIIEA